MFCPNCGSEERQLSQFCRGCGMDLRVVRTGLERVVDTTSSADAARAEIGRAIAERITQVKTGRELRRLTEHVLPQVDKFLETAEDKRLRRMRAGVITSAIGLGGVLMFMMIALASGREQLLTPAAMALVVFIVGLGILINGKTLTVPSNKSTHAIDEGDPNAAEDRFVTAVSGAQKTLPETLAPPLSVIEHTTHKLSTDPVSRQRSKTSLKNNS